MKKVRETIRTLPPKEETCRQWIDTEKEKYSQGQVKFFPGVSSFIVSCHTYRSRLAATVACSSSFVVSYFLLLHIHIARRVSFRVLNLCPVSPCFICHDSCWYLFSHALYKGFFAFLATTYPVLPGPDIGPTNKIGCSRMTKPQPSTTHNMCEDRCL